MLVGVADGIDVGEIAGVADDASVKVCVGLVDGVGDKVGVYEASDVRLAVGVVSFATNKTSWGGWAPSRDEKSAPLVDVETTRKL